MRGNGKNRVWKSAWIIALVGGCLAGHDQMLIVPHLPKDTANFQVTVVIDNLLNQERHLVFDLYDAEGTGLGSLTRKVPPQTRETFPPEDLFGTPEVAHFLVRGGFMEHSPLSLDTMTGLVVGVRFQMTGNSGSASFVQAVAQPSRRWRVYPGDWDQVFDGLAVVSLEPCINAQTKVEHYGADGKLLASLDLSPSPGSAGKALLDLAAVLEPAAESYVDIRSNAKLAITALRGSQAQGAVASYLVGNMATPMPQFEEEHRRLEENRARWALAGITAYVYDYRHLCFCEETLTRQVTLMVNQNRVQWVRYSDDDQPVPDEFLRVFRSVEELFDLIEEAIAEQAQSITVTYDPEWGYPTEIFIDVNACLADEEITIQTKNLRPVK